MADELAADECHRLKRGAGLADDGLPVLAAGLADIDGDGLIREMRVADPTVNGRCR